MESLANLKTRLHFFNLVTCPFINFLTHFLCFHHIFFAANHLNFYLHVIINNQYLLTWHTKHCSKLFNRLEQIFVIVDNVIIIVKWSTPITRMQALLVDQFSHEAVGYSRPSLLTLNCLNLRLLLQHSDLNEQKPHMYIFF